MLTNDIYLLFIFLYIHLYIYIYTILKSSQWFFGSSSERSKCQAVRMLINYVLINYLLFLAVFCSNLRTAEQYNCLSLPVVKTLKSLNSTKLVEMFIKWFLLLSAINFLSAGRVPQPEERIIGGKDIEIEDAPWQVSLQVDRRHYCGGSIYSKDIIITAAHCRFTEKEEQIEAKNFTVRVGSSLENSDGILIGVAAIKSHENYTRNGYVNDIAVMRLSEPLVFSSKVQRIPLAEKNPSPGALAKASGWGAVRVTNFKGKKMQEYPEHLQGVDLQIVSFSRKDNIFVYSYGRSTCSGDSGGPLVVDQQLVGVASTVGTEYCYSLAAFAGVPYFRNWILNAIESLKGSS
ncbi:trypsin beta-like [Drosophila ficusphila]|uniref:trypsin beta-like n=1 Tax=Drosophila ficusphila TaxID=30025 RepID=UPI001C891C64|nr:trypsin beta-like [Drosophila ficusphila]